VACRPLH